MTIGQKIACLPLYNIIAKRFICLEKADLVGFKGSPLPVNLREAHEIRKQRRRAARAQTRATAKGSKGICFVFK